MNMGNRELGNSGRNDGSCGSAMPREHRRPTSGAMRTPAQPRARASQDGQSHDRRNAAFRQDDRAADLLWFATLERTGSGTILPIAWRRL